MQNEADLDALVARFGRIDRAVSLGIRELTQAGRAAVRVALSDACEEAVRVAETMVRLGAEEDLWPLLGGCVAVWARLAELVTRAQEAGAAVRSDPAEVEALARQLHSVGEAAERVEDALQELARYPGDRASDAAVRVAVDELLTAGDQLVPLALAAPGTRRLDAAVAVLTSVAAAAGRAERERRRLAG